MNNFLSILGKNKNFLVLVIYSKNTYFLSYGRVKVEKSTKMAIFKKNFSASPTVF